MAGALAMACSGSDEAPVGDDAGLSSGSGRTPGGGAKPGNTIDDNTSSSGGKRPSASSSGGSSGVDGGASGSSSSSSGEPGCEDPDDTFDPNFDLTPSTPGGEAMFVDGVLNGEGDLDEYSYDVTGNYPGPNLFLVDQGPVAKMCFYATCISEPALDGGTVTTAVTCGDGMTEDTDTYGQLGCCSADGSATRQLRVQGDVTCNGALLDHVFFYVDVTSQAAQCKPYTLRVGF